MTKKKWHKLEEKCPICKGTGKLNNEKCLICNGVGKIVLRRVSDSTYQPDSDTIPNFVTQWINEDREGNFYDEIDNASDRAVVIVGAAALDDALRQILTNFLIQDETDDEKLFENQGPLESFSARIKVSYRLGLINKVEKEELYRIRNIRNIFAHQISFSSFDYDQSIKEECYKLRVGKIDPSVSPRTSFTFSTLLLKRALDRRARESEQERRKPKDDN